MSERLTQEELRERIVVSLDSPAGRMPYYCLACHKTEAAGHLAGCPCDKGNVVVSRDWLERIATILRPIWEQDPNDLTPEVHAGCRAEEVFDMVCAALREEPTT